MAPAGPGAAASGSLPNGRSVHLSWIDVMADAAELLARSLAGLYCCVGARPGRAAQVCWQDLVCCYPDLDANLT